MSYSPTPGAHRIDVADDTGRAYRVVLDNLQLVGEMALLPFLVVLATQFVAFLLPSGGIIFLLPAALIQAVGFLVFGTIFVVRWHRFVLLGESVSPGLIPPGWVAFFVAGVKVSALVFTGWVVLVILALLPPHLLTMPLTAIGGVGLTLFSIRVSLIFPAAAIERPVSLRTAWDWVTGNFWRLFVCLVVCYLPFIIVELAIRAIGRLFPSILALVFTALSLAVSFVGIAVVAALLSHLYRDIVAGPGSEIA